MSEQQIRFSEEKKKKGLKYFQLRSIFLTQQSSVDFNNKDHVLHDQSALPFTSIKM